MKFPAWIQLVACFHVWYLIFQVGKLFDFPASAYKQRLFVIISGGTFPGKARKGRHQTSPPANKFTFIIITLWRSEKFRVKQNSGRFSPEKSILCVFYMSGKGWLIVNTTWWSSSVKHQTSAWFVFLWNEQLWQIHLTTLKDACLL